MQIKFLSWVLSLSSFLIPVHYQSPVTPGALDQSFGNGGKVVTRSQSILTSANSVAIQRDGKIVVAGRSGGDYVLVRYNADGTLDSTFRFTGAVYTDFFGFGDQANAIVIQADGKIIAAGSSFRDSATGVEFSLARYNSDGSADQSFGVAGQVGTAFSEHFSQINAVAVQPDGKIVAAGGSFTNSSASLERRGDFALVRYQKDGSIDESFGDSGKVTTDFMGGDDEANAIVIQPDGKILASGYAGVSGSAYDVFAASRYNPDGRVDTTFGTNGKITIDPFDEGGGANAAIIQPDNKIVLAGYAGVNRGFDFALLRLNPDGSLDPAFGVQGRVFIDFFHSTDVANAIGLQRNGKLVCVGMAYNGANSFDFGITRLKNNGAVDDTFGDGGRVAVDFFGFIDEARAVAIQDDGKIVVAGYGEGPIPEQDIGVVRLESSAPVISSVAKSGKQLIVSGAGFEENATILLNGIEQNTANDGTSPSTRLIAKKAGKRIRVGDRVQVLNSDGVLSAEFIFTG